VLINDSSNDVAVIFSVIDTPSDFILFLVINKNALSFKLNLSALFAENLIDIEFSVLLSITPSHWHIKPIELT